jgi:hypothetical protein
LILSEVNPVRLAAVGFALIPLGIGGVALLQGAPGFLIGGLALMILVPAINQLGKAVQKIGDFNFVAMAVGLAGMGAAGLLMWVGAPGFIAMAVGLTAMAAALYLFIPLMPMIMTLAAIGGFGIGGGGEGKGKGEGKEENEVVTKLDELIELTRQGKIIVMNGQKVGETALASQRVFK